MLCIVIVRVHHCIVQLDMMCMWQHQSLLGMNRSHMGYKSEHRQWGLQSRGDRLRIVVVRWQEWRVQLDRPHMQTVVLGLGMNQHRRTRRQRRQ